MITVNVLKSRIMYQTLLIKSQLESRDQRSFLRLYYKNFVIKKNLSHTSTRPFAYAYANALRLRACCINNY